jgi:hypothetical protein
MPIRRSPNGCRHTTPRTPQTDRDAPERVVGIDPNTLLGIRCGHPLGRDSSLCHLLALP